MKAHFFTEASGKVGFGHLTRCLALAQALKKLNIDSFFFVNGDNSIENIFDGQSYQIINWQHNLDKCFQQNAQFAIIDSYLAPLLTYKKIASKYNISVAIDDNCRLNYPTTCIINGSTYAESLNYYDSDQIRLLGPKYILLRASFQNQKPIKIRSSIKNILVTFGGDDFRHLTLPTLKHLDKCYPDLKKTIIVGNGFDNINEIVKEKSHNIETIVNPNIKTLIKKMKQADCAISAGGQTLNELAKLGIPTVTVLIAENQQNNVKYWSAMGYTVSAGKFNDCDLFTNIINGIKNLSDLNVRKKRQLIGLKYSDGKGSFRIARKLLSILKRIK